MGRKLSLSIIVFYCLFAAKIRHFFEKMITFASIMSIQANIPEIAALRREVESRFGRPLHTHADFVSLTETIEVTLHEHLSPTTLERVWGYSTRHYDTVSRRTLDVLARYVGADGWDDYVDRLRSTAGRESEEFTDGVVNISSLAVGARLLIGWQPDRLCEIRYLGNFRFVVERVENSALRVGDSFSCMQLQLGQELYMDCFQRAGEPLNENARYAVGQSHGLTTLRNLNLENNQ
jgi:hypothetical protein